MREVEKRISELKDTKFNDLTRPISAFITFEEEDAYLLALEFNQQFSLTGTLLPAKAQLLGEGLYFEKATEPTNIIWENRFLTPGERFTRSVKVSIIILILVLISFSIIFACKSFSTAFLQKYPQVDCAPLEATYGTYTEKWAAKEFDGRTNGQPLAGALQCFCNSVSDQSTYVSSYNNQKICKELNEEKTKAIGYTKLISYLIIFVNYTLRIVIIKLIQYIGKDTETGQTELITNGVFIVQFFNTAILLLLVNANFYEQASWLGWVFNGSLTDFQSVWFNDIGYTLVGAMMFNIYWPAFEFFAFYMMRTGFRLLDRNFSCNKNKTKKTTVQQYVELYSGPVYFIHYKYSSILNITFVTFMYGIGVPLLFPIAVFSFFVLYLVEKSMLYWSYRQPPMYDDKLNKSVLKKMTYAPLLFLAFGYWMLSNNQLFGNSVFQVQSRYDPQPSGHYWTSVFTAHAYK
jgi:hypothetical protein